MGPSRHQAVARHSSGAPSAAPGPTPAVRRDPAAPTRPNHVTEQLLRAGMLRANLTVSQAGDPSEEEADRMADTVMRMPTPTAGGGGPSRQLPAIQRQCAACQDELKRTPLPGPDGVASAFEHPRSAGRPLSDSDRHFFEPRFGHDLSAVRIHTGDEAARAARSVGARAYAMGRDVVFGAGEHRPGADDGRRLLAHELTHVLQWAEPAPPAIRRTIGDGHDLVSYLFTGDPILEAVYDGERELKAGVKGGASVTEAVRKLQVALMHAVPRSGFKEATGTFGPETSRAVEDFQRASGLGGGLRKGIDGVVDAITMGWLDQLFANGKATPPGKGQGATPGCPAYKSVTVDLVSLDGSTRYMFGDLRRAISIFNQCCVRFEIGKAESEDAARTRALLGGDTVLTINDKVGDRSAEELAMFKGVNDDFKLSSRIRAIYVGSIASGIGADAYSIPPVAATGTAAALTNMVVISNTASDRGLAHEFGHVLLNRGADIHGEMDDPEYLMSPASPPTPGERITLSQCATIFDNA